MRMHIMRNFALKTFRRLTLETGGSEIAEAAAVLPVMFMILLGIFWFGQAYNLYGAITRAAQEGARAGAAPYCTTCVAGTNSPGQNAVSAAQAALTASNLNPAAAQWPTTPPLFNSCIATQVGPTGCDGASSAKICVQTPVQLTSTVVAGAAGVCGIAVTFQYPFNMSIPFVANTRGVLLTATARVRMETR